MFKSGPADILLNRISKLRGFIVMKKLEGFSLIELLVVVAIIGVLAAVGVVGYQQYINNTKADVAKTNAQGLERWLASTQLTRSGGLTVAPTDCNIQGTGTLDRCFDETLTNGTNGPLAKFKNPYQAAATAPIVHYDSSSARAVANGAACNTFTTAKGRYAMANGTGATGLPTDWKGVLVIQNTTTTDDITKTTHKLVVGYCDSDAKFQEVNGSVEF